jgi:predicted dehydrogenase
MIRAAIVGMGNWGHNLVTHVQGKSQHIQFVAGATRTPEKARAFAEEFNLKLFDSYDALLASDEVDAVVLATPHTLHTQQIIAAAKAGKHVFSEKPIGLDLAKCKIGCTSVCRS